MALLLTGLAASSLLVVQHVAGLGLPGCEPGGGCAEAATSRWGSLAGWPVSFFGLAYFAGLTMAWLETGRGGTSPGLRAILRAAALISVGLLLIMALGRYRCPFCLVVHCANLSFWALSETSYQSSHSPPLSGIFEFALIFTVSSGVLGLVEWQGGWRASRRAEEELKLSIDRILQRGPVAEISGGHRLGPENALARFVIFSDYQCPSCKKVLADARRLVDARDDVSLSIRHFPLSPDCNPAVESGGHLNACRAAKAAEAAAYLQGENGFWKMDAWLSRRGGEFTDRELDECVRDLGLGDPETFRETLEGDQVGLRVHTDVDRAREAGVVETPAVFLNGVELRGWNASRALERAVRAISQASRH